MKGVNKIENIYNKKISEITTINSGDFGYSTEYAIVKDREDLRKIIEEPCLPACLTLYDKNIQTVNSSANKREIGGRDFSIKVPIFEDDTVGKVSDRFIA